MIYQSLIKSLKSLLLFLVTLFIIFAIIEGASSFIVFSYNLLFKSSPGLRSRVHVKYNELLGWVNIPNLYHKDMYGPGIDFKTNSQSFRNNGDFDNSVPADKLRIICSGDSFTLGVGVDNDHTWCQLFSSLDPRFETVNMGEAGYGIDQSYLKYKRYGSKLEHDIHIFAFIYQDFMRMGMNRFTAYDKPVLMLRNNEIVADNVPVPHYPSFIIWLRYNRWIFQEFKSVDLGRRILNRLIGRKPKSEAISVDRSKEIAIKVFENLHRMNIKKGSTIVFVYLPYALNKNPWIAQQEEEWRQFLQKELEKKKILFVDLMSEVDMLPYNEKREMFDTDDWKHYSIKGNEYIANLIYERLVAFPEIAKRLAEKKSNVLE